MRIEDMAVGKKYYEVVSLNVTDRPSGKKKKQLLTYRVVELDVPNKRVCASKNLGPAQWYKYREFGRWKKDKPDESILTLHNERHEAINTQRKNTADAE